MNNQLHTYLRVGWLGLIPAPRIPIGLYTLQTCKSRNRQLQACNTRNRPELAHSLTSLKAVILKEISYIFVESA